MTTCLKSLEILFNGEKKEDEVKKKKKRKMNEKHTPEEDNENIQLDQGKYCIKDKCPK